jgi:hypothetical protein
MLSGYHCDMYDERLTAEHGWRHVDFPVANHAGVGRNKSRRVETVWMNY